MDIFEKARRLEGHIARGMTRAAKNLVRGNGAREPIELAHAIVDCVEREIQSGDRGTRVFPFNTVGVSILAASEHERIKLETAVSGAPTLRDRISSRLRAARCPTEDLDVSVHYVPRAHQHWIDPQFAIAFSRVARNAQAARRPSAAHLEVTIVNGEADRGSYSFASHRIDLGRGSEVRDRRNALIRTNDVAFAETPERINRSVSRQHSHIALDHGSNQFRLHDDGSVHGTRIVRRGRTLPVPFGSRGVRLQSGDEIVLGEARVRVTLCE
jgi:FHA domain